MGGFNNTILRLELNTYVMSLLLNSVSIILY